MCFHINMDFLIVSIALCFIRQSEYVASSPSAFCQEDEAVAADGSCQAMTNANLTTRGATTTPGVSSGDLKQKLIELKKPSLTTQGLSPSLAELTSTGKTQKPLLSMFTSSLDPMLSHLSSSRTTAAMVSENPQFHCSIPSTTKNSLASGTTKDTKMTRKIPSVPSERSSPLLTYPLAPATAATKKNRRRQKKRKKNKIKSLLGMSVPEDLITSTITTPTFRFFVLKGLNKVFPEGENHCPTGQDNFHVLGCQTVYEGQVSSPSIGPTQTTKGHRLNLTTPPQILLAGPNPSSVTARPQTSSARSPPTSLNFPPDTENLPDPSLTPSVPNLSPQSQPAASSLQTPVASESLSTSLAELTTSDTTAGFNSTSKVTKFTVQNKTDENSQTTVNNGSKQNPTLSCRHLLLDNSLFSITPNGSVILKGIGILNDKDFRILTSDVLKVCVSALRTANESSPVNNENDASVILTSLSLVSSQVFLLLTFILHCCFHELRNLPGLNLMCLSFSLFMTYAILFFGTGQVENQVVCKTIGVVLHYFWLSSFAWLNICSFHTFRVFWFIFTSRNLEKERKLIMIKYGILGFGMPSVVVTAFILTNYSISGGASIGYSDGSIMCFCSPGLNNYIGLFLPSGLTLLVTIILYIFTLTALFRRPSKVRKSRKTDTWAIVRYIKLSSITGFSWIFAFLYLADRSNRVFNYLFIILTGFQGVFIFLAFITNKRVYTIVTRRCREGPSAKSTNGSA